MPDSKPPEHMGHDAPVPHPIHVDADTPWHHGAAGRLGDPSTRSSREKGFRDDVDDASEDSFPASDPPPWSGMRLGGPPRRFDAGPADRPGGAIPGRDRVERETAAFRGQRDQRVR
jgi:hypothetical protein